MSLPFDVASLQTPCFVFDEAELRRNFSDFRRALADHWSPHANVAYSVKTNPFPWILEVARDEGSYAEVVSNEESHGPSNAASHPRKSFSTGRSRAVIGCFMPWTRVLM